MATLIDVFNLGQDAELRYTAGGEPVCNLHLAYSYGKKDSDGNYPTQWVEAALWGERAEKLAEHLTKGRKVFAHVEDPHVEPYPKKDGTQGHKLVGRCGPIRLVDKRDAPEGPAAKPPATDAGDYAKAKSKGKSATKASAQEPDDGIPY